MTGAEIIAAMKILQKPLNDLYEYLKDVANTEKDKILNTKNTKKLARHIESLGKVKTFWQLEKEVNINDFYYPSKIINPHDQDNIIGVNSLNDISKDNNFVIEGTVGQGKSIFLRYVCIQELREKSSGRIPIFIELRKIDASNMLSDATNKELDLLGLKVNESIFKCYAESGKFVLLLDAFDELDETQVNSVMRQIEFWCDQYPLMQIIVTSRPDTEIRKLAHFRILKMAPLDVTDHKHFFQKIGVKGSDLSELLKAIENSPQQISGLLTTPLLLTLLVLVYGFNKQIPEDLPEFFEALFSTVFMRHDRSKPYFKRKNMTGFNERKLEKLFKVFCFYVFFNKFGVSLNKNDFSKAFDKAINFFGEKCDEENFRNDIIKIACLMQNEGLQTTFIHKSILEYFTAAFISELNDEQANKVYETILSDFHDSIGFESIVIFLNKIDKYRFTKLFYVPGLDKAFANYGVESLYNFNGDFDHLMEAILHDFGVYYMTDQKNGEIIKLYCRSERMSPYYFFRKFYGEFGFTILNESQIFTDFNSLSRAYPSAKYIEGGEIRVQGDDIIQGDKLVNLKQRCRVRFNLFIEEINESKKYIEKEDAKITLLVDPFI